MTNKDEFIVLVKKTIQNIDPTAQVILFGSRARGDFKSDSDWDFLILIKDDSSIIPIERQKKYKHPLYEIEWETGNVICSMVLSTKEWNSQLFQYTPLYQNIHKEGIIL